MDFVNYLRDDLLKIGYTEARREDKPTHSWMQYEVRDLTTVMQGGKMFNVFYIRQPIEAEWIREAFTLFKQPCLFVVDQQLLASLKADITMKKQLPVWFRALHAIYYGRVYTWTNYGEGIKAFHVDYDKADFAYSETIVIDKMVFAETDSWLRDFKGNFSIARFTDSAFWKYPDGKAPPKKEKQQKPPNDAESFWQEEFKRQRDPWGSQQQRAGYDAGNQYSYGSWGYGQPPREHGPRPGESPYEYFNRINEEEKRRRNASNPPPPGSQREQKRRQSYGYQVDDQWLQKMLAAGSLDGAKKVFRKLAQQYHPDVNKADDAVEVMKAINNAYDRAKSILS